MDRMTTELVTAPPPKNRTPFRKSPVVTPVAATSTETVCAFSDTSTSVKLSEPSAVSAGVPLLLARLKKPRKLLRLGGDFLWESYTERTEERVLLKNFYPDTPNNWTAKEKQIFKLTKQALHAASTIVFTTNWQRGIWAEPYGLD